METKFDKNRSITTMLNWLNETRQNEWLDKDILKEVENGEGFRQ